MLGDLATTTTVALAASWPCDPSPSLDHPSHSDGGGTGVLVLEADPTGGSVGAWLDLPASPTLSTVVTRAVDGGWPAVDSLVHDSPSGIRVVPAPTRSMEASRAVAEADRWLFGLLAGLGDPVVVADLGSPVPAHGPPAALGSADVAVVVHRQATQSARAAAVRIERLDELVDLAAGSGCALVLAVVGDAPFDPDEILRFVAARHGADGALPPLVRLPDDPLAAAVLAGRSGVSARRLARLPLMRAASHLAATVATVVDSVSSISGGRSIR